MPLGKKKETMIIVKTYKKHILVESMSVFRNNKFEDLTMRVQFMHSVKLKPDRVIPGIRHVWFCSKQQKLCTLNRYGSFF